MGDKCTFCDYADQKSVVAESENFYAIPSFGQISDGGHMLVIPKKHYVCLGAMEDKHFPELEQFTGNLKKAITDVYGKPISFEHGILGQSIPHAHLQMMPTDVDLFKRINRDFRMYRKLSSIRELRDLHRTKGVYLYYQNTADEMFGFMLDSFPQYFRIIAAEAIGKPQRGNWREWRADVEREKLDDLLFAETIKKLRDALA